MILTFALLKELEIDDIDIQRYKIEGHKKSSRSTNMTKSTKSRNDDIDSIDEIDMN